MGVVKGEMVYTVVKCCTGTYWLEMVEEAGGISSRIAQRGFTSLLGVLSQGTLKDSESCISNSTDGDNTLFKSLTLALQTYVPLSTDS